MNPFLFALGGAFVTTNRRNVAVPKLAQRVFTERITISLWADVALPHTISSARSSTPFSHVASSLSVDSRSGKPRPDSSDVCILLSRSSIIVTRAILKARRFVF
jgi:hypothetical protein